MRGAVEHVRHIHTNFIISAGCTGEVDAHNHLILGIDCSTIVCRKLKDSIVILPPTLRRQFLPFTFSII